MNPQIEKFFSKAHWREFERAKAAAQDRQQHLGFTLKQRGLAITDEQEHQILACGDHATVDRWIHGALSAASVDELLS